MLDRSSYRGCLALFLACLMLVAFADQGLCAAYNPCRVPPQISFSGQPNILLVWDFSGSMQDPANHVVSSSQPWSYWPSKVEDYFPHSSSSEVIYQNYNSSTTYYGLFKSEDYYKYDANNGWFYSIGDRNANGSNSDMVGNVGIGIRGNLLNWALTSKMDAALMAMIGGKACDEAGGDCDDTDSACFRIGQGSRRQLNDTNTSNTVQAEFYIRPGTWTADLSAGISTADSLAYPDSYSGGFSGPDSSYPDKELIVGMTGYYRGKLDNQDPDFGGRKAELWVLTLSKKTGIKLALSTSAWSGGCYLKITNSNSPNGASVVPDVDSASDATMTALLDPGTYYVVATSHSNNKRGEYLLKSNVHLQPDGSSSHDGNLLTKTVGAIPWARVRVKISPSERTGAIQQNWTRGRFGFMYYKGDAANHKGRLLVRCGEETSSAEFVKWLEGKKTRTLPSTDSDYKQPYPYGGTPTGEALREAYYYLRQTANGINQDKRNYQGQYDPYYTLVTDPTTGTSSWQPVSCRNSHVVLISDGEWYHYGGGAVDPIEYAHKLHTEDPDDLRTDIEGAQLAEVYSIFAFSAPGNYDYTYGVNTMKWVAAYGGHRDLMNCGNSGTRWPWDKTGLLSPQKSTDVAFSIPSCNTSPPNRCCKEWDLNGDKVPDNYFFTSTGDQLGAALASIMGVITQQSASSSAVATVAQQTGEGDLIIRGMFEAKPPDDDTVNAGRFLWFGHLETYWPDDGHYDFELSSAVLCEKMGLGHCWDAAIAGIFPTPTQRKVYTLKNGALTVFNKTNIAPEDLGLSNTETTKRNNIVDWVLGTDMTGYRARKDKDGAQWVLGDIVYSTPVVVGAPSLGAVPDRTKALLGATAGTEANIVAQNSAADGAGFNKYFLEWRQCDPNWSLARSDCPNSWADASKKMSIKFRDKMVYVGGNDGMVHAFLLSVYDSAQGIWAMTNTDFVDGKTTAEDKARILQIGKELWAYIPSNLLTELKTLADENYALDALGACKHRFMVDLADKAWEVYFDSETTSGQWPWHTILLGGERGGGDTYFALDVTDARGGPKLLWEYSVLKDVVATFDFKAAAAAFRDACFDGTRITPGDIGNCKAPDLPTSWWNHPGEQGNPANCDGCACAGSSGSTCNRSSDDSACLDKLKAFLGTGAEQAIWCPFNDSAYSGLKTLPVSWSKPYVGRVGLPKGFHMGTAPPGVEGNICVPKAGSTKCPGGVTRVGNAAVPTYVGGVRNIAFVGGGIREFDTQIDNVFSSTWPPFYWEGFRHALHDPFLLALDIETGVNIFRHAWPAIFTSASAIFPEKLTECDADGKNCGKRIPYAMSDPVALDLWDLRASPGATTGEDGYVDSVYVGDINGVLYGIKINFDPTITPTTDTGIYVDVWKTKPIPSNLTTTKDRGSNVYRSERQPFTVQPATSWERIDPTAMRILIAGGKHEDVDGEKSDQTDIAKMSLYNLQDKIDFNIFDASVWATNTSGSPPVYGGVVPYTGDQINFRVRGNCENRTYRCTGEGTEASCSWTIQKASTTAQFRGCSWLNQQAGAGDCCEADCASPCWKCVYDLTEPGEKVIGKPLIAGGIVFFTTFKPTSGDACNPGGTAYLYAFDYMCQAFPIGFNPIANVSLCSATFAANPTSSDSPIFGVQVNLGTGIPSQPVIDSTGGFLTIQLSNARFKTVPVNLLEKMSQIQGWQEKEK